MTDDLEDWEPLTAAHRLVGGPCDGEIVDLDRRHAVVQVCEAMTKPLRRNHVLRMHAYEKQIFLCGRDRYTFWVWSKMTSEERLAAVEKRL